MVTGSPLQFEAQGGFLLLKVLAVLVQAWFDSVLESSCEEPGPVPSVRAWEETSCLRLCSPMKTFDQSDAKERTHRRFGSAQSTELECKKKATNRDVNSNGRSSRVWSDRYHRTGLTWARSQNTPASPWLMTSADLPLTLIKELQNNPCAKQMMCSSRTIAFIPVVAPSASCHPLIAVACKELITSAGHYATTRCVWLQPWQHDLKRVFASFFPRPVGLAATTTHKTTQTGKGMGLLGWATQAFFPLRSMAESCLK